MMRALPWMPSVIMPTWEPVKDWAEAPSLLMAMASRAMEIRSPADRSMSISRAGGGIGDLRGQVQQLVGGVAHGGDHNNHFVASGLRVHNPLARPA